MPRATQRETGTPDAPRRALTINEAAALLGISRSSYYKLAAAGRVPHPRRIAGGGAKRVDALAVQRVLEESFA